MMSYYDPIVYVVLPEDEGMLLKTVLQNRLGVSRKLMSKVKLTEYGIQLNGQRVYISEKVKGGDRIELRMEKETSEDILPEPIPFDILYEDAHLLVVNKPAGLIVHPTSGHYTGTLANGVVHYWQEKGEQVRFRPVHRLDQDTSGVLCIAKNPYVHQHISEQMIQGTVDKYYTAIVHGYPEPAEGIIDGPIDRDPLEPHRRIVTPDGYPARTLYHIVERYPHGSMVQIKLESGRTHQIRVHMSSIGCPLIGDTFYSADQLTHVEFNREQARLTDTWINRQALHASKLSLTHPLSGERVTFTADLPADMAQLKAQLEQSQD
ncbi:RluA family pseudouridine synthase [Paenibacillus polygoni]|uniref:Pseudouridine synthase n=1 Tax=Paenibacillus polygoni TaxID=3050112 RepID=A0ABY8XAJ2_9BACL|nr:RluA family pseudouridine synthase [Paenibacillus polygoni]WIV20471.1 RluA family pseudouridine synthase [Paenibacillus polygoni]